MVVANFMKNVTFKVKQEQRGDAKDSVSDIEEEGQFRWKDLWNK